MPVHTKAGEEAVVTAWLVDEGSPVKAGQLIAEIQVEKVALDVLAPVEGVVIDLVAINQPVPQGKPICLIVAPGEAAARPVPDRVAASPAARRLARELGVDLATLRGSGPGGRITEADVNEAAGIVPGWELSGLRATIARNVRRSQAESAAFTLTTTVDVTDRVPRRITAWVLKVVGEVLARHPHLNGQRAGDRFIPAATVNLSLAIQTEAGLVAPVVTSVNEKTIEEIAAGVEALADKARAGKLEASDFEGGTFTVTNLGSYGIDAFTPIINFPQVAILGVGAIRTVPALDEHGQMVAHRQLTLSLTIDHAFVDGAPAAAFLADLRALMEA